MFLTIHKSASQFAHSELQSFKEPKEWIAETISSSEIFDRLKNSPQ